MRLSIYPSLLATTLLFTVTAYAKPIIGYSKKGTFDVDNLPPQLKWMLEIFAKQIDEYAQKNTQKIPLETVLEWENLKLDTKEFKEK